MSHLHCRHCGLHVTIQPVVLFIENCPRCRVRHATVRPLVLSSDWRRADIRPGLHAAATGSHLTPNAGPPNPRRAPVLRAASIRPPVRKVVPATVASPTGLAA